MSFFPPLNPVSETIFWCFQLSLPEGAALSMPVCSWVLKSTSPRQHSPCVHNYECSDRKKIFIVVVHLLSCVLLVVTLWTAARRAPPSFTVSWSLLKFMSIELVMPFNHLILCLPLLLLPSIFPGISVFSNMLALCIRWLKCWSFSFSISPSSEHSGLISFMIDWFDLLAAQGTFKSLLQHHRSKASILRHSAFFIVQVSHLYMTTGKMIALAIWTFVRKVMSLLFNILSRFITAFLSRSKQLLISWLQPPFTSISTRTRKCLLSTYYGAGCIPTRAPGFASHKEFPSDVLLCSFFLWLCFQPSRNLNCAVVWAFFGIAFLWDWNENWPFPVLWPLLSFPNLLAYWV